REHYPELSAAPGWLPLASWIGGDRDGNPLVVTPVTAETLRLHRGLAVERHRRALLALARRLSLSDRRCPPPAALAEWLESRRPLPMRVARLEQRYAGEPYRLALSLLAADLETASQDDMTARLLDEAPHQALVSVQPVARVLDLISGAIPPAVADSRRERARAARLIRRVHDARHGRRPGGDAARALGRLRAGAVDRAAVRDARRSPGGAARPGGAVRAAGLSRPPRRGRRAAD